MSLADGPGTTNVSLLVRLRAAEPEAWSTLVDLYGPMIYGWCRRSGLADADVQDVGQEVFRTVLRGMSDFRKSRPDDTFRGWLKTITRTRIIDFWRQRAKQPEAVGGSSHLFRQGQIEFDTLLPNDEEPDEVKQLAQRALQYLRSEFSEKTVQAFLGTAVEQRPAAEVGQELGMTANAVNIAKLRVSRALRLALGDLDPGTA